MTAILKDIDVPQVVKNLEFSLFDMNPEDIYTDMHFSQELELSTEQYFEEYLPDEAYTHDCSSNITEIDGLHTVRHSDALAYYEKVKEYYKDKLPLGRDTYLSGGNHFHIFITTRDQLDSISNAWEYIAPRMYNLIHGVPLYAKFKKFEDGKMWFFSRRAWWHRQAYEISNNKSCGICAKDEYSSSDDCDWTVQSLEFRMNWVIDNRIYGLYQASMLYAVDSSEWIIEPLSISTRIYNGISYSFNESEMEENNCITLDKLKEMEQWFFLNEQDKQKLKQNIEIALKLLRKYGLINAANSLQNYIDEYNIPA